MSRQRQRPPPKPATLSGLPELPFSVLAAVTYFDEEEHSLENEDEDGSVHPLITSFLALVYAASATEAYVLANDLVEQALGVLDMAWDEIQALMVVPGHITEFTPVAVLLVDEFCVAEPKSGNAIALHKDP